MSAIKTRYSASIEVAITKAKAMHDRGTVAAPDGAEVYAYPHKQGAIAWGINAAGTGVNILRGIRRPDGTDEGVT